MQQLILIFHILIAIALVALVLLQQGKGAEAGAGFGAGASQTFFGSQGSGSFLLKLTGGLAFLFFATSIALTQLSGKSKDESMNLVPITSIEQEASVAEESSVPEALRNIPGLDRQEG